MITRDEWLDRGTAAFRCVAKLNNFRALRIVRDVPGVSHRNLMKALITEGGQSAYSVNLKALRQRGLLLRTGRRSPNGPDLRHYQLTHAGELVAEIMESLRPMEVGAENVDTV